LRLALLDIEHGHAEIKVVGQCQFNQFFQPVFRQEILPGNIGGVAFVGVGDTRILRRHGCRRTFVVRHHRATGQSEQDTQEQYEIRLCHRLDPFTIG